MENEEPKLCVNMDCERYPPDWDFEKDTEETYQEDQWKKCSQCDGYYNDDGMGIFYTYKKSQIIKKQSVVFVEKLKI